MRIEFPDEYLGKLWNEIDWKQAEENLAPEMKSESWSFKRKSCGLMRPSGWRSATSAGQTPGLE